MRLIASLIAPFIRWRGATHLLSLALPHTNSPPLTLSANPVPSRGPISADTSADFGTRGSRGRKKKKKKRSKRSAEEAEAAALMEATKRAGALDIAWSTFDIALTIFLY